MNCFAFILGLSILVLFVRTAFSMVEIWSNDTRLYFEERLDTFRPNGK